MTDKITIIKCSNLYCVVWRKNNTVAILYKLKLVILTWRN